MDETAANTNAKVRGPFDIGAEAAAYFDDSSRCASAHPKIVVLLGGVAAGKTTIRRSRYSAGYVLVDAADIFIRLSRGDYFEFPSVLEQPMNSVGTAVARRAIRERRHIVTELIGGDERTLRGLIEAMRAIGYAVDGQFIFCDVKVAMERNLARGPDSVSAYYAEPFNVTWLVRAAEEQQRVSD